MSQITKKQHYIPKAILKYFSYDRSSFYEGQILPQQCYKTNINNSMCERNIYEADLLKTNAIESFFAETVDSDLAVFEKDINDILNMKEDGFVEYAYNCVKKYIISIMACYFRSGAILLEYNTAYSEEKGQNILKILGRITPSYITRLCRTILFDYDFSLIQSDKSEFLIGDQYIATAALRIKSNFSNASNRQIGFKHTILILPVSSSFCVVFFHGEKPDYIKKNQLHVLNRDECKQINLAIRNSAYRKIAGSNLDAVSNIIAEKAVAERYQSPMTAVMKYESGRTVAHVMKKEVFFYPRDYEAMELFHSFKFDLSIGRNDKCYCGSGKKYKNCCFEKIRIIKEMKNSFLAKDKNGLQYSITPKTFVEESILIPENKYGNVLNQISGLMETKNILE